LKQNLSADGIAAERLPSKTRYEWMSDVLFTTFKLERNAKLSGGFAQAEKGRVGG